MSDVAERFLKEERAHSGPRIDPVDRARFHRLVRLCAENWLRHTLTGLRMSRGKQGISLQFDGCIGGRVMSLFTLRVDYRRGEYRFTGPNADRERMGLDSDTLETLERLRDLYAALLSEGPTSDLAVTATLRGKPFPDLLPLVEETRRVLDGRSNGTAASSSGGRGRRRARKTEPAAAGSGSTGEPGTGVAAESVQQQPQPRTRSAATGSGATASEPVVTTIILSCPEPKDAAAFYRRIFGLKSLPKVRPEDHAIYEMGDVTVVLRRELSSEERRRLGYGSVQRNRGWGMTFAVNVPDFKACLRRVKRVPNALISEEAGGEIMTIRDPAGYILEVSGTSKGPEQA